MSLRDVRLVKPSHDVVEYLAAHMRVADVAEVLAASGKRPIDAIRSGLERSSHSVAALVDGVPVCVLGVGRKSALSDIGVPWMLATPDLDQNALGLMRRAPAALAEMLSHYGTLENYVDERNVVSARWLRRLGFQLEAPAPFGVSGLPFHRFWMTRDV